MKEKTAEAHRIARELVEHWLHDELDSAHKKVPGTTHRWLFCWEGGPGSNFDCACCLAYETIPGCGCICHERVESLVRLMLTFAKIVPFEQVLNDE